MAKDIAIKTKRLMLSPMNLEALEKKVLLMEEGELRQAYQEMLEGCRKEPENWLWYTPWVLKLKGEGTPIGDLCFKGPPVKGTVEWGYGIEKAFWGQGYMTEAARVMLDWAFSQKDVYAVEAETLSDNAASQRVLSKLDFKPTGTTGQEGPRFRREKQAAQMSMVYMMLGMCCGISVGMSAGNMALGMVLGMAVGFALGTAVDSHEKKYRQRVLAGEPENKTA